MKKKVIGGATSDLNSLKKRRRVEKTKSPKELNLKKNLKKPVGHDIMLLILEDAYPIEPCKINIMRLPSLNYKPPGLLAFF